MRDMHLNTVVLALFQATGNQKHLQAVSSTGERGLWGGEWTSTFSVENFHTLVTFSVPSGSASGVPVCLALGPRWRGRGGSGPLGGSDVSEVGKEGVEQPSLSGVGGEDEVLLEEASGRVQVYRGGIGALGCLEEDVRA